MQTSCLLSKIKVQDLVKNNQMVNQVVLVDLSYTLSNHF